MEALAEQKGSFLSLHKSILHVCQKSRKNIDITCITGGHYSTFCGLCKWKDFKRVFLVASLCSVVALLFVSCGPTSTSSNASQKNKVSNSSQQNTAPNVPQQGIALNESQQTVYDSIINSLEQSSATRELPADVVAYSVKSTNDSLSHISAGFHIKDTQAGSALPKGTKKDALKKRFIPVKA